MAARFLTSPRLGQSPLQARLQQRGYEKCLDPLIETVIEAVGKVAYCAA